VNPFALARRGVLGVLAFAAALALAACAEAPAPGGPVDPRAVAAARLDRQAALASLNAYRARNGLAPLRLDPALAALAQRQVDAMAAADALSHTIDGSLSARLAAAGIAVGEAGENLGGGYYSLDAAMAGWRGSPEHDANLKIRGATRMGIAIAKDPRTRFGVYWALELADDPPPAVALQAGGL
jgi:uncharacterized protein YkwD